MFRSKPIYAPGDVVQLKSGGSPLTVTGNPETSDSGLQVTCVSSGGLMQQFYVPYQAVKLYTGPMTPSQRK